MQITVGQKKSSYTQFDQENENLQLGDLLVKVVNDISATCKLVCSPIVSDVAIRLGKNVNFNKKYNLFSSSYAAVVVDENLNPIGSRSFGSVPNYFLKKRSELLPLALELL